MILPLTYLLYSMEEIFGQPTRGQARAPGPPGQS